MNTMQIIFLLFTFFHVSCATVADQFTLIGQGYCKTSDTPAHLPQNRPHHCSWVDAQKGNFEACTHACMQMSACIGIEVNPDEDRCIAYVEYQGAAGTATAEVTQQCADLNGNLWVPRSTIEHTGGITHSSGKYLTHTGDCYSFERSSRERYEIDWLAGFTDESARSMEASVGDGLTFTWMGGHNVYRMPSEEAFDSCDFSNAEEIATESGTEVLLSALPVYFAGQVEGHCLAGQKLAVTASCGDGDVWLEEFEGHIYPHMYYEGAWHPVIANGFWNNQNGYDRICKNLGYSSGRFEGTRGSECQKLPAKSDGSKGDGIFLGECPEGVTDLLSECGKSGQISPKIKHAPNRSWCALDCSGTSNIAPKSCVPTTTLQPTAEPTRTPTFEPTLAPTMAYDCTVEVFKSYPDNSDSELIYEENAWIDLSLEGISSLIVTGTCSVTVRDGDENVLATYTEGTYICCGGAADQERFPNAQGLMTWNDRIRSVYLYSTLGVESTEDWNFVNEDSTSYSVSLFSADERELLKSGDFEVQCDLSFRLQRDDSKSYSTFTYLDLDTKTVHTQKMRGGYQNHQRFEMPSCTQITCHHAKKGASCPWTSKNAILLAVDFRPRSGSAYRKQWKRNRFTFTGTHYYATPTTENRRRLPAGSSLERLMKRFI